MLEKNERIIFSKKIPQTQDTDLITKSLTKISLVNTTFYENTGERSEEVYFDFFSQEVSCIETKNGYYLNISLVKDDVRHKLREHCADFGTKQTGKNSYSRKEIKIEIDEIHGIYLFFGAYNTWFSSSYETPFVTFTFVTNDYKDNNYILNDGIKMSLDHSQKDLFSDNYLNRSEIQFVEKAMALQNTPEWKIKNSDISNKVDNNILEEISGAIKQGLNAEDVLVNVTDMKISKGFEDAKVQLNSLIGLDSIKEEIEKLEARLSYNKDMKSLGFYDKEAISLHMAFLGAPGTGKTTVARIITGMLSQYGYIKKNKCVEINGRQLVGSYVGQTGNKTAQFVRAAMGGVLFIDEAYSLVPADGSNKDFSHEAIAQLLKSMEDLRNDLIVILAGYEKDMERLFNVNEGMRSRINRNIYFKNYTALESAEMFLTHIRKDALFISKDALEKVLELIKKCALSPSFSNGRFVRNLYEKIIEEHSFNVRNMSPQAIEKITILEEDISDEIIKDVLNAVR